MLLLAGVVLIILACGYLRPPAGVQEVYMLATTLLSIKLPRRELRRENRFGWGPIIEVAVIFAGIFATMVPALSVRSRTPTRRAEGSQWGSRPR